LFRVIIFVDDRKLPKLLHQLPGLAMGQPEVVPVSNAQKRGGKIVAKSSGNSSEMFMDHLKQHKITNFTPSQAKEVLKAIGLQPGSISYMLKYLRAAKLIRHNGKNHQDSAYTVVMK
jgi:hypothetical protein